MPYFLMMIAALGIWLGSYWPFIAPLALFGLHPLLDQILKGRLNPQPEVESKFKSLHEANLQIYPLIQLIFFIFAASIWVARFPHMNFLEMLAMIMAVGSIHGGLGLAVAHELVHRIGNWHRALGVFVFSMANYAHYRIEHVYGHHRHVATPKDAAFVPEGQNLYTYIPKSAVKGFLSAWNIERKVAKSWIKNRMVHYLVIMSLVSILLAFIAPSLLLLWWGQSIMCSILLETINYVEHYGLERRKNESGRYEKVNELHSWDSDFGLTNHLLFNLGKHAHHHAEASKEFYNLKNYPTAADLPVGYSGAVLVAFLPPVWKRIMDVPLIERKLALGHITQEEYQAIMISKANRPSLKWAYQQVLEKLNGLFQYYRPF